MAAPERGPLTKAVLQALRNTGHTVGDGEMPDESWIGQPNMPDSVYSPFAVLSALTADRSSGPLGDAQGDWRMPYMVECFGVRRGQADWMGDKLAGVLEALRGNTYQLGSGTYKVQYVRHDNIGQAQCIRATNPPFWHRQDGITVWIGREVH